MTPSIMIGHPSPGRQMRPWNHGDDYCPYECGLSATSDGGGTIQGWPQPKIVLADVIPRPNNGNWRDSLRMTAVDGASRQRWSSLLTVRVNARPWLPQVLRGRPHTKIALGALLLLGHMNLKTLISEAVFRLSNIRLRLSQCRQKSYDWPVFVVVISLLYHLKRGNSICNL